MKLWALALVVLVGCYEPSAAERYNSESEALDRLEAEIEGLKQLKSMAESPDALKITVERWNGRKSDFEQLESIQKRQLAKVRDLRLKLGN